MTDMKILQPGPAHPITVEPTGARVTVAFAGRVVADSDRALTLREASYPPVQYIPLADVDPAALERSSHASYCPYKGKASYYSLRVGGSVAENAAWSYEHPYDAVAAIEGHLAFYPDRVEALEVLPAG
jgi:uncharacterized protein (DUF427 family)